ncbi:MAG TPA: hypothetical protein VFW68_06505 [Rhodocyclaceae bacterium]|nr:hypothetical protein [Rhodocyclaceae bacterium]
MNTPDTQSAKIAARSPLRTSARVIALAVACCFSVQVLGQPAPQVAVASDEEYQPKFIWGILINIAVKYAITAFTSYMIGKLTDKLTPDAVAGMVDRSKLSARIKPLAEAVASGIITLAMKEGPVPENTVAGVPTTPIKVENGRENYQAVHVALLNFDRQGNALSFHPVTDGFTTGQRFKLRVLPTFDGLLTIDNINPRSERKQIYPPAASDVVQIKAGQEILLPLGKDDYFEFAGATGDDQLVVTVRDPRAFGAAASTKVVTRKDENNGSNFMQELDPNTYPVISQSLHFQHRAGQ